MSILETVEESLKDFRPKNQRQFVVLNVARRFDDLPNLAAYLNICDQHPKRVLLEAARLAEQRARETGRRPAAWFFELLAQWSREEAA